MRIISHNVNGIRSATTKGVWDYYAQVQPDIICLQEIKIQAEQMTEAFLNPMDKGMHGYFSYAQKAGYSGVALYCKEKPLKVISQCGLEEFDNEGRWVQAEFENCIVVSAYFPSGSASEERQLAKFRFLEGILPVLKKLKTKGKPVIVCGDVNIAHQEIDLKNWKGNLKNSGFTPEERAWITALLGAGWLDTYRSLYPETVSYTWWSNRGQARANNVGWRIDYQLMTNASEKFSPQSATVYTDKPFSDHAPLVVDYKV